MLDFFVLYSNLFFLKIGLRNQIFVDNYKLIFSSLKSYRKTDLFDDLCQNGAIYYLRNLERYDPAQSALATFIVPQIKGSAQHYFRDKVDLIKTPRDKPHYGIIRQDLIEGIPSPYNNDRSVAEECIGSLPKNYNKIAGNIDIDRVVSLYLDGYNYKEIDSKIGYNSGTTRKAMQLILRRLRSEVAC